MRSSDLSSDVCSSDLNCETAEYLGEEITQFYNDAMTRIRAAGAEEDRERRRRPTAPSLLATRPASDMEGHGTWGAASPLLPDWGRPHWIVGRALEFCRRSCLCRRPSGPSASSLFRSGWSGS